jgi:hypothetical protein
MLQGLAVKQAPNTVLHSSNQKVINLSLLRLYGLPATSSKAVPDTILQGG